MSSFYQRYEALIAQGELKPDPDQQTCAKRLAQLQEELEAVPPRGSLLWRTFGKKPEPPRGIYMWGGVGRGKSMLMDLLYENLDIRRKKRAHFHEFMLRVHDMMRAWREADPGDPIPNVVRDLAQEARCLAFDEMVVNNSADAMIMSRLFTGLVEAGVTLIATSNRPPRDLYKDGLNREHFLPFVDLLETRLDVISLNGPTDYRRERLGGVDLWHVPNGEAATKAMSEAFFRLTDYPPEDRAHVPSDELEIQGARSMHVPKALKGVAVFSFKRLCAEARGATDYLAIARKYHSVIIVGIPLLSKENRNEAARFVTLIDALYEYKVKLLASADAEPDSLYPAGDGSFEFERTASRLIEMQSDEYLALGHGEAED
ncbi:cell division protein ZapE [Parasphingorhabdus halotolerans]|uniref:Cell division protein ZapE n=1 Tax=Parasphingorhabdus halotolerans TaxID=2725558 RepID=A0A6H2DLL9_9SPHN|nr:cell division protein ZapE [Parasphingorhabdus halotolerans]QJB69572.1 cell division protein ZapE [Parasphingorhabdus halotolerans]